MTRRRSRLERAGAVLLGGVVILHGTIHLLGAAKGLGWADVPALAQPISAFMGVAWLLAAVVTIAAGALFLASVRWWWMLGAVAVLLSQVVILTDWSDAALGTAVNVLLAAAVTYAYAAHGPRSLESEYRQRAGRALRRLPADQPDDSTTHHLEPVVTERDLDVTFTLPTGRTGAALVPNLLGAVVAKAAALTILVRDASRDLTDAAFLLTCMDDPDEWKPTVTTKDETRLGKLRTLLDNTHNAWAPTANDHETQRPHHHSRDHSRSASPQVTAVTVELHPTPSR